MTSVQGRKGLSLAAGREATTVGAAHGLVGLVLAALLLTACGRGATSEAPWGLDTVTLPSNEASVSRVIAAMPETVAGQERVEGSPDEAVYEQMKVRVLRLDEAAQAEGFPATAREYLERLAESGEVEVETQQLDADDDLVYLTATTTANEETVYVAAWAEPDSEWLFSLSADSVGSRVALVNAFVDAVASSA